MGAFKRPPDHNHQPCINGTQLNAAANTKSQIKRFMETEFKDLAKGRPLNCTIERDQRQLKRPWAGNTHKTIKQTRTQ